MRARWKFYGRKEELQDVSRFVDTDVGFSGMAIYGRRNVGKTALLGHFMRTENRAEDPRKIILCTLNATAGNYHRFVSDMREAVKDSDPALLKDYMPRENDAQEVVGLSRHILENGHILVIDEFQRIRLDGDEFLECLFQKLIDDLRIPGVPRADNWNPRLIVMGSEQQRLVEMFKRPIAPMFNRIDRMRAIHPWTFSEFNDMARDQGWDQNPNRLLTLWTAYNGIPGHWERFRRNDDAISDFRCIHDDDEWTRRFLAAEDRHRKNPGGRFKDQMEVQLRSSDLILVRWLAEKPSGRHILNDLKKTENQPIFQRIKTALQREYRAEDINDEAVEIKINDAIEQRLSGTHLGFLRPRELLNSDGIIKWAVNDHFAQFQMQVIEPFENARKREITQKDQLKQMANAEGMGLEAFAAEAMRYLFKVGADNLPKGQDGRCDIRHHVERKGVIGDIDVFVIHQREGNNPERIHEGRRDFWIGSVKRRPESFRHINSNQIETDVARDMRRVQDMIKPLTVGSFDLQEDFKTKWRNDVHFVVISRSFSDSERQVVAQDIANARAMNPDHGITHVYSMDIADMMSGRGPQLLTLPND